MHTHWGRIKRLLKNHFDRDPSSLVLRHSYFHDARVTSLTANEDVVWNNNLMRVVDGTTFFYQAYSDSKELSITLVSQAVSIILDVDSIRQIASSIAM